MTQGRAVRLLLSAVALGVVYAGIYRLIILGSSFGASIGATFWPASGVTASVLILRPRREWPAYLTAIWIADFLMDTHGGGYSAGVSLGVATANCAEPLLSASLLRRWLGIPDLSVGRDVGLFFLAAAGAGPLLSSVIASLWQSLLTTHAIWPFIGRWYVGDALGVIVIGPVIMSLARDRSRPKWLESGVLLGLVLVAGGLLCLHAAARNGWPFLVIPVISLVAIRIGTRAAAAAAFLIAVIVEVLSAAGTGPFAGHGDFTGLVSAQMYVVACSASGLTAAALMAGLVSRDRLALHDSLTGLANRRLLMNRTALSLDQLARSQEHFGLVFMDLDGFKQVNDAHGHAVGDLVLAEVARRLQTVVHDQDTVARIGGDEFVILVERIADPATLAALVARVERVLAQPIETAGLRLRIGASVGRTICESADDRAEDLLSRADSAMYEVKRARARVAAAH